MKRTCFLTLIVIHLGNFSSPMNAAPKSVGEDEIREVVFRYGMNPPKIRIDSKYTMPRLPNGEKPYSPTREVFFLSIENDKDPSVSLIKRFIGYKPIVRKISQSEDYRDKSTGDLGVIYSISSIKWLSKNRVKVEGSYRSGGRGGNGWIYSVIRKNNKWTVENRKDTWVS